MCYGYIPVKGPDGSLTKVHPREFKRLMKGGRIVQRESFVFPGSRDTPYIWVNGLMEPREMRFDLVPRFFKRDLPRSEMLKEKTSRRKGSDGFSSYNARSETMLEKPTWKSPWREAKRMVVPVAAFFERPNEEDAPKEFRGREYKIHLKTRQNLAGLFEHWENSQGESLDSFGIITVGSKGNGLLESIHHSRCPLILEDDQLEEWLNPETPLDRILEMIRLFPADQMEVEEITKPKPEDPQQSLL